MRGGRDRTIICRPWKRRAAYTSTVKAHMNRFRMTNRTLAALGFGASCLLLAADDPPRKPQELLPIMVLAT